MSFDYTPVPMLPLVQSRLVGNSFLVAMTLLVVALRILTRLLTGSRLGWDDYLILAAVPQGIGILVCQGLCEFHIHTGGKAPVRKEGGRDRREDDETHAGILTGLR